MNEDVTFLYEKIQPNLDINVRTLGLVVLITLMMCCIKTCRPPCLDLSPATDSLSDVIFFLTFNETMPVLSPPCLLFSLLSHPCHTPLWFLSSYIVITPFSSALLAGVTMAPHFSWIASFLILFFISSLRSVEFGSSTTTWWSQWSALAALMDSAVSWLTAWVWEKHCKSSPS